MKEAYQVVYSEMEKAGLYNKKKHDEKNRGVEIQIGDHVLVQNVGKDKAGKIKSYWEQKIWLVVDKKDNVPVYTLRLLNGSKTKKIHRNLLMKVNNLPLDAFGQKLPAKPNKKVIPTPELVDLGLTPNKSQIDGSSSDDSDIDELILPPILIRYPSTNRNNGESQLSDLGNSSRNTVAGEEYINHEVNDSQLENVSSNNEEHGDTAEDVLEPVGLEDGPDVMVSGDEEGVTLIDLNSDVDTMVQNDAVELENDSDIGISDDDYDSEDVTFLGFSSEDDLNDGIDEGLSGNEPVEGMEMESSDSTSEFVTAGESADELPMDTRGSDLEINSLDEESDMERPPLRRSKRERHGRKVFTFDRRGGDPRITRYSSVMNTNVKEDPNKSWLSYR